MDWLWLVGFVAVVGGLGLIAGSGTGLSRDDLRSRGRWDQAFEVESRRLQQTDATGVLRCRASGVARRGPVGSFALPNVASRSGW